MLELIRLIIWLFESGNKKPPPLRRPTAAPPPLPSMPVGIAAKMRPAAKARPAARRPARTPTMMAAPILSELISDFRPAAAKITAPAILPDANVATSMPSPSRARAKPTITAQSLRQQFVMLEILQPPVSLRDPRV